MYYVPEEGSGYEPQHLTDTIRWRDTYGNPREKYEEVWEKSEPEYRERLRFQFTLIYHPGTIYAVAAYTDGHLRYTSLSTPSDGERLSLRADRECIAADGRDMTFVEINALDRKGELDALNSDRIRVTVEGAGVLASIDTGNSVDYESYQSCTRRLFNGKAVAYIQSNGQAGEITITVKAVAMAAASLTLSADKVADVIQESIPALRYMLPDSTVDVSLPLGNIVYARKLELFLKEGNSRVLTEENPVTVLCYRLLPEKLPDGVVMSDGKFQFSVIGLDSYIRVNYADIRVDERKRELIVTGLKPGTFRVYGTYTNGWKQPQLLSDMTIKSESAVSVDRELRNDAYTPIAASRLDSSSRNSSYQIDYETGVIHGLNRPDDTLVYKDVEFGTDYSRQLVLNCANTSGEGVLEVYVDQKLSATVTVEGSIAGGEEEADYRDYYFDLCGVTGTHTITFYNRFSRPSLHIASFYFTNSKTAPYDSGKPIKAAGFDYYTAADHLPVIVEERDPGETESVGANRRVLDIQDNTAVYYKGIDFGKDGKDTVYIRMRLSGDSSRIAIKIGDGAEQYIDWTAMDEYREDKYVVYRAGLADVCRGVQDVMLMAYPGSDTYIDWFCFGRWKEEL